jgi:hypothetical protein
LGGEGGTRMASCVRGKPEKDDTRGVPLALVQDAQEVANGGLPNVVS